MIQLGIKTDYSLLSSLIKIDDLILFLKKNKIPCAGIIDSNLSSSVEFYFKCIDNDIKPVIGLELYFNKHKFYLYAKNYNGYKNLLKINTIIQKRDLSITDLEIHNENLICVIPCLETSNYNEFKNIFKLLFVSYQNEFERKNSLIITEKILYLKEIKSLDQNNLQALALLESIKSGNELDYNINYSDFLYPKKISNEDQKSIENFISLIDIKFETQKIYLPKFDKDSKKLLYSLCKKGLIKRCNGIIDKVYTNRLKMELEVIEKMGFIDYFLIVYDYVLYAKTHDILVGPGRGSAAGSLVSYCLGITDIDPIKYNLLFERFLNIERISLPDIDIDFEDTKREEVVNYVTQKYGKMNVAKIITYGTFGCKQALRDVAKCFQIKSDLIDGLCKMIDSKISLKENLQNPNIKNYIHNNPKLQKTYEYAIIIEGFKRHTSTHAAGIVISSVSIDDLIPLNIIGDHVLTGITMEYLEKFGLVKMDFLALENLTTIKNTKNLIETYTNTKLNLNDIPLDDKLTLKLFYDVDTTGIFQYESVGMKNFLKKLHVNNFSDLTSAIALYRPGPMENIDCFIRRKEGKEKITYLMPELQPILQETYGIIVYQEQIIEILKTIGGYSYSEADNIRRAMSKKKYDVMNNERKIFIEKAKKNGYDEEKCNKLYDLIIKFANYGFNKSHSVSYAIVAFWMAYIKAHYPKMFIINILNSYIGDENKTKEYIKEAKIKGINVLKPMVNKSEKKYVLHNNSLLMPLSIIKNVGIIASEEILKNRNENYKDIFDFVSRNYSAKVNKKVIEMLIDASAFREFGLNKATLHKNIDSALNYAEITKDIDESLILKPEIIIEEEYNNNILREKELKAFGFYISNHPASIYNCYKSDNIKNSLDKIADFIVLIEQIKKIKTKNNEDMAFILGSDENGEIDFVVFPKLFYLVNELKKSSLVKITGKITKRFSKYSVIVNNITIIKEEKNEK